MLRLAAHALLPGSSAALSDLVAMQLAPSPTLITLDLSYLSLTKALPIAAPLLASAGHILALVKPLFEVESHQARRSGRIDDPELLVRVLQQVIHSGSTCDLTLKEWQSLPSGHATACRSFLPASSEAQIALPAVSMIRHCSPSSTGRGSGA